MVMHIIYQNFHLTTLLWRFNEYFQLLESLTTHNCFHTVWKTIILKYTINTEGEYNTEDFSPEKQSALRDGNKNIQKKRV